MDMQKRGRRPLDELTVNLNESIKSTGRVMNGYIYGYVHK